MFNLKDLSSQMETWQVPEHPKTGMPRWMLEDYSGMEQDIAADLYGAVFWHEHEKLVEKAGASGGSIPMPSLEEQVVRTREMATALMDSTLHARNKSEAFDRAFAYLAWKLQQTGAYHFGEFDSVMEFLVGASIKDRGGELNDIKFLLEDFFPMLAGMQKIGWSVEDVLAIEDNWSRTRAAIPFIRHAMDVYLSTQKALGEQIKEEKIAREKLENKLEQLDADGITGPDYDKVDQEFSNKEGVIAKLEKALPTEIAKAEKTFNNVVAEALNAIADPSIKPWSTNPADKTIKSVMSKTPALPIYPGQYTAIPGGNIFVMIVPQQLEKAIQSALATIIQFSVSDPEAMVVDIYGAIKKSPFQEE